LPEPKFLGFWDFPHHKNQYSAVNYLTYVGGYGARHTADDDDGEDKNGFVNREDC
jgi:hypothetical protein